MSGSAERAGRRAEDSDALDHMVRVGLVAYGLVHLMLAWLALQLAFGHREGETTTKGALAELAEKPFGHVLVWAVAVGMFLLVLWRLLEAVFGNRDEDGGDRAKAVVVSVAKAVIYGVLGVSAVKVAVGGGGSSGSSGGSGGSQGMTAKLLGLPAGPWIVGLVGLAVIGYGGALAWRGWSEKFAEHLDVEGRTGTSGKAFMGFGKVGYIAKGVSLALVGGLFCWAGLTHDPDKSGGLDQALRTVLEQPFGQVLLALIAIGIGCYGLFCFARAKHLSR